MRNLLLTAGLGLLLAPALPTTAQAADYGPTVSCSSNDNRQQECAAPFRGRAVLVQQMSKTQCIEGRNWGYRNGRIWVTQGCRGRFAEARGGYGRPGQGHAPGRGPVHAPPGRGPARPMGNNRPANWRSYSVSCSSDDNRARICGWDSRMGRPVVIQQMSKTQCIEGRNWGLRNGQLWVDDGCRARFGAR